MFRRPATSARRHHRLNIERLEERTVMASWLGQIGGPAWDSNAYQRPFLDSDGNSYVAGYFAQTAEFGPSETAPSNTLTSAGGNDGFLAKYSPDGALVWARRFGNDLSEGAGDAVVDDAGAYAYVTGSFGGTVDFGNGFALTSAGDTDTYMLKLDAGSGNTVWAKRIGGKGTETGEGIATDDGRVYVVGVFTDTVDFDPGPGTVSLIPNGKGKFRNADGYVLALDANGNYVKAWQIGGKDSDAVNQVIAQDGSLYLKGGFWGTTDFDPGTGTLNKTSAGSGDLFLAKYSTSGALSWVQTIGNTLNQDRSSYPLTADADSLYLTGFVREALDFDPGSGATVLSSGNEFTDAVVAKYAKSTGSLVWANQYGAPGDDLATVSIVDSGAIYVGGGYTGSVDFDPDVPGSGELNSTVGSQDGFLLKLDATQGNYMQVWTMGGPGSDIARPSGVIHSLVDGTPQTTLYVTGGFKETAAFPTGGSLTSAGENDVFLMAFEESVPLISGTSSSSSSGTTASDVDLALVAMADEWSATSTSRRTKKR